MARKNFAEGIEAVLGGRRPQTTIKQQPIQTGKKPVKPLEVKTSINMDADLLEKLRALVFWERSTLKIELENAIELYIHSKGDKALDQALEHFRDKKPNGKIKG